MFEFASLHIISWGIRNVAASGREALLRLWKAELLLSLPLLLHGVDGSRWDRNKEKCSSVCQDVLALELCGEGGMCVDAGTEGMLHCCLGRPDAILPSSLEARSWDASLGTNTPTGTLTTQ